MTINDFITKRIAIAFTSPKQVEEFAKMCEGHRLKMQNTGVDACKWMMFEPEYLFDGLTIHNEVVHFIYDYMNATKGRGMSWFGDDPNEIKRLVRSGWNILPFEKFRECVDGIYTIVINCNGNDVTTAKMIINGKVVKETRAKRNPEDKFDFKVGARIAFDRLFERVLKDEDIPGCEYCVHFDRNSEYCQKINCQRAFARWETADFDQKPIKFKYKP